MKKIAGLLAVFVCLELVLCGLWVTRTMSRPAPPQVHVEGLDHETAGTVRKLQIAARDGNARDWRTLAGACLGEGFYSEAEQCFRRAVELDPQDTQSLYGQGFCLERMGRLEEANRVLLLVLPHADPELTDTCWYQIGRNHLRGENPEQAERAFRSVSRFAPAAYYLAKLLIRTGRYAEADSLIENQLSNYPDSLKLVQLQAYAAEAQGDESRAWRLHQWALHCTYQLTLEYSSRYFGLFRGRFGLLRHLTRCLQLKDNGTVAEQETCLDAGIAQIEKDRLPQYQTVYVSAVRVALGRNRPQRAMELLELLQDQRYETPEVVELLGDVHQLSGDTEAARAAWERANRLLPSGRVHAKLANSYADGDDESQVKWHQSRAYFYGGTDAFQRNELQESARLLQKSTEVIGDRAEVWYALSQSEFALGHDISAEESVSRCLSLNPRHGRAREAQVHLSHIASEEK